MTTPSPERLEARELAKVYRGRRVVDGLSLRVERGEVVGLLGPNGAGKTTTFNLIVGLVRADGGTVHLDGVELTGLPMYRRARRGLGYLPQEPSIFRRLTVRQNMLAVLELNPALAPAEREARADAVLQEFQLAHLAQAQGETLSGGERRRAEIARCLLPGPRYILFDEPFAGVDPLHVAELQREIKGLRDRRLGVLITDHNVRDTLGICDRAYVLTEGRILLEGTPQAIAEDPAARAAYLGSGFKLL